MYCVCVWFVSNAGFQLCITPVGRVPSCDVVKEREREREDRFEQVKLAKWKNGALLSNPALSPSKKNLMFVCVACFISLDCSQMVSCARVSLSVCVCVSVGLCVCVCRCCVWRRVVVGVLVWVFGV